MYKVIKNSILIFVVSLATTSVNSQEKINFDWLLGSWKANTAKALVFEIWKKQNDSLYTSVSGFVKGKDTTVEETVELKKIDNSWYYIPTTANQNNGEPVAFKIIFCKNKEFICENVEHDFPQRINYRLFGKNLFASIEGKIQGMFKKVNYDYFKM